MKNLFYTKTLIALAVAVAAAAANVSRAQEQPIPPPSVSVVPGSPLAEVVKMVQAGVDMGTVQSYIANSSSAFNLDADKIIYLKDIGAPSELINAMMDRDKVLYASNVAPPPAPVTTTTVVESAPDTAPPPAEVTVNYFYDTLTPYGSWVDIDGYGRCWRPTTVIYDASWRPYGDRGHWVNTDYGWYWDSDYSWGMTFHYGRWFHHAHFGWVWYPDTVWAPSWVTWRSGGDYCGWAPLPPFAVFTPGVGFYYRGVSVGLDFDFGLGADCFMFLPTEHFCDRRPGGYFVASSHVTQIFHQTTVINNFNVSGHNFVNHGIAPEHIASVTHREITPVHVSSMPNAGRQGWRGEGYQRSFQHSSMGNSSSGNVSSGNNQLRHGPEWHNEANAAINHQTTLPGNKTSGNQFESSHLSTQPNRNVSPNNSSQNNYQSQYHTEATTGNTHSQSQTITHEQPTYQPRQFRSYGTPTSNGQPQHGATQLEQHQSVNQSQSHVETRPNYVEPAPRNYNPPPAENHNTGGNSGGGSSHGSDNNNNNNNKQNH